MPRSPSGPAECPCPSLRPHLLLLPLALCLLLLLLPSPTNAQLGKRRLCGKILTQELRRVCTKPGTRGPCLHGQFNSPAKRASSPHPLLSMPWHEAASPFLGLGLLVHRHTHSSLNPFFSRRTRRSLSTFPDFLDRRRKRAGIAEKCCAGTGCDDQFLDSFCCDDDEEMAFKAIRN